ncbi:hypothetical protein [Kocuria varians]|uniref:hypothetical protein n=1 Tax=Kocuria varians TaxID=1272 RepID=UPI00083943A8|nr:hypothetical protein [Kocuria varians]
MTQQPETPDPIQSAGQIDDPDQPTTVGGQDDSRAGRDTQPDESSADGDPEQPGAGHRSPRSPAVAGPTAGAGARTAPEGEDGATAVSSVDGSAHHDPDADSGKPPKAVRETGVPVVPEGAVDAQGARELDSEALAGTRKFQPPADAPNPNVPGSSSSREGGYPARSREGASEPGRGNDEHAQEPVRHSVPVEERVEKQERDYDLHTTEDGERYLTPTDDATN